MDKNILRNYARLIARSGVNIMPGQEVVVRCSVEQAAFMELLAEELYEAGASQVHVEWNHQPLGKLDAKYQSDETMARVETWEEEKLKHRAETLPATISIASADPDGMVGVDQAKLARAQQAQYKVLKPYWEAMENKYQWCVAAVPGVKWAKKLFPALPDEEAVEKLWGLILHCARADGPDPVETWREHSANIHRRCDWLNSLKLRRLVYKSESTGTDFSVGLIPEMLFCGGSEALPGKDLEYNPNIPSEEVFTTPLAGDAEGIVYASMPLSYRGVLIENFSVRFEKGRVVEVKAEKNEEALRLMVGMDEGAAMLGECALVPWESPIRESGVLFFNTLFDENASCHLALGRGYSSCMKDYDKYTPDQLKAMGVNESMIHVDFMIGAEDLCITGLTEDGREIPIFVNGRWAED